jgi:hypothetical protein
MGRLMVIVLVGSTLAGCGATTTRPSTDRAGRSPVAAVVDPACESVQVQLEQLRAQAASWSPSLRPFDKTMGDRVRKLAEQLSAQQRKARDTDFRKALTANVQALDRLGRAIARGKDKAAVQTAVGQVQATYVALKGECRIGGAAPSTSTGSSPAPAPSVDSRLSPPPEGGLTAEAAQGPVCLGAKRVFTEMRAIAAGWSPQRHPFDPRTARLTGELGQRLAALASSPGPASVRTEVHASAVTLEGISAAMGTHRRAKVYDALGKAQLAYNRLRTVCALG